MHEPTLFAATFILLHFILICSLGLSLCFYYCRRFRNKDDGHFPRFFCSTFFVGWLGSQVVSVLDSGAEGPGFNSQPRRYDRPTIRYEMLFLRALESRHESA